MAQSGDLQNNWKAKTGRLELRFIELEEITLEESVELRSAWPENEEQEKTHTELRLKLHQAMARNRQERALQDQLMEQEQKIENMIKEETAEKNTLVNRVNELKQKVERLKNKRLINEEDHDNQMSLQLKSADMCQTEHIKQLKEDFSELQKQHRNLTVHHNQLVAQRRNTLDSLSTHKAAEVTLKVELEQVKRAIRAKDKEIQQICTGLKNVMTKICNGDIIKELVLDWKNIFEGIQKGQGHVMGALKTYKEGQVETKTTNQPQGPVIAEYQEKKEPTSAGCLWKVTLALTLCGLFILLCTADYDTWTVPLEAVESYCRLSGASLFEWRL